MKRERQRKKKIIRDFRRLFNWYDLAYIAGNFLYRKGIRIAGYTAIFTTGNYISNLFKAEDLSIGQAVRGAVAAIGIPIVVGVGLTGTGFIIRNIPNILSKGKITVAEANDLNLMEDYKKFQSREFLEQLWDRIFRYEAEIQYSEKERANESELITEHIVCVREKLIELPEETLRFIGIKDRKDLGKVVNCVLNAQPVTDKIEKTKRAFIMSTMYGLCHSLPQTEQAEKIGFDLSAFEDWRDGAYFDSTDTKLSQQYSGDVVLTDIKKELGFGASKGIKQLPIRFWQSLCFNFVTKAIAIKVGTAIVDFNRDYATNKFNSQLFLWPGSEDAEWLEKYDGSRRAILERRKEIIKGIFGESFEDADITLDRMFLPNFEYATKLRMKYDPEYCFRDGLEYDVLSDLKKAKCCEADLIKCKNQIEQINSIYQGFLHYLNEKRQDLFKERNAEALRAVKIAFHINKEELRSRFIREGSYTPYENIADKINEVVSEKEVYSEKLRDLRLHHQLTIFEMAEYRALLQKLAYSKVP